MVHLSSRFQRKKTSPASNSPSPTPSNSSLASKRLESPPVLSITTTPPSSSHSHNPDPQPAPPAKSPFRAFHFRSNKRGRSPVPASLPGASSAPARPATATAVKRYDEKDHRGFVTKRLQVPAQPSPPIPRSYPASYKSSMENSKIPAFLAMSQQDISEKFESIQEEERFRVIQSCRPHSPTFRFARCAPETKHLDRYINIQPWMNNRVKLQVPEGEIDYVNASPITLPSPLNPEDRLPHRYIAMQGPKYDTTSHVWRMVTEQLESPAVIVMLTETHEMGMEKCYPYFPATEEHDALQVGGEEDFSDGFKAQVRCASVEEKADGAIEVRKINIRLEETDEEKTVWHLLYRKWPDFGVPGLEDLDSFFELMRLSRDLNASEDNPRIIHCSAGVGRTGTFITLEHLMREIESGELENYDESHTEDLVYDTVNSLREQRRTMVQADVQYLFIYQVLRKLYMDKYGIVEENGDEPAAKRLELEQDPFVEEES